MHHHTYLVYYEIFDGKHENFRDVRHNDMLTIDDILMIKYIKHLFSKIIVYEEIKMRFKWYLKHETWFSDMNIT